MGANHSSARGTFGNGGQYQQPVVYAGGAQAQGQRSFQAHQSTFLGREEDAQVRAALEASALEAALRDSQRTASPGLASFAAQHPASYPQSQHRVPAAQRPASYPQPLPHSTAAQEDEELQIALALSASEAQNRGWTRPGEASGSHAGEASTSGSRLAPSTSQDEEFARRLQQEEVERASRYPVASSSSSVTSPGASVSSPQPAQPQAHLIDQWQTPAAAQPHWQQSAVNPAQTQHAQQAQQGQQPGWPAMADSGAPPAAAAASAPWNQPQAVPVAAGQGQPDGRDMLHAPFNPLFDASFTSPQPAVAAGAPARAQHSAADDEALARQLQQQMDLEAAAAHGMSQQPSAAEPHVTPHVTGPSSATVPSSPAGSVIGPSEPKRAAWAGNWSDSCAGCGQKLSVLGVPVTSFIEALGKKWHPGCLRCGGCQAPIAGGMFVIGKEDNQGYHPECYKHKFHPRCAVCSDFMPVEADGRIVYCENGFWRDRWCRRHQADGTPRCTSCARMRPAGEQWVPLEDGRELCLACIETIIMDTAGCQPLYNEILQFYDQMGMRLPEKPPLMLVDGTALNEAENKEGREAGSGSAPVFHTRGLTLTVEYRAIRTVAKGHGGPFSIIPHMVNLPGRSHTEVTAILVLYGLPRLLTGSILAHELMHAWLRLNGISGLSLDVEEGLCQLMALLWLESQDLSQKQGTWEERLASFFAHQIRTDTSPIYGDGFRGALDAFQKHGLPDTLACVRRTGTLPV